MRLIVCGSAPRVDRPGWTDRDLLERTLDVVLIRMGREGFVVVEGEALGADQMAREWAEKRNVPYEAFPANWSRGRGAGMIRNRRMLASGADRVLAFSVSWPPTTGADGMCRIAVEAAVPATVVTPDGEYHEYGRPRTAYEAFAAELADVDPDLFGRFR